MYRHTSLLLKIRETSAGFIATEKPWTEVEGYNLGTNMFRKLIVQTLRVVKQVSFEIFIEGKKIKSMQLHIKTQSYPSINMNELAHKPFD